MKKKILSGTTESGFKYSIDSAVLDDYEIIEILQDIDNGAITKIPMLFNKLFGEEQANALKEHLRKDGRVSLTDMMNTYYEIMKGSKELKKS